MQGFGPTSFFCLQICCQHRQSVFPFTHNYIPLFLAPRTYAINATASVKDNKVQSSSIQLYSVPFNFLSVTVNFNNYLNFCFYLKKKTKISCKCCYACLKSIVIFLGDSGRSITWDGRKTWLSTHKLRVSENRLLRWKEVRYGGEYCILKGKAIPVQANYGSWGFQEVKAPRFQDKRHMKIPGTHFCWRLSRY